MQKGVVSTPFLCKNTPFLCNMPPFQGVENTSNIEPAIEPVIEPALKKVQNFIFTEFFA